MQEYKYELSNYELKDDNYDLIGRQEQLEQCLKEIQNNNKICVYGAKGVGKRSFVKKVGLSSLKEKAFNKVYFLEINSIDNNAPETKINLFI